VLVDWLEDKYQNAVMLGIHEAARRMDVDLLIFTGGVLDSPQRQGRQRNSVYRLPQASNLDGLLVMTGAIGNYVTVQRMAEFCRQFHPLPMCSIAVRLPGMPSVLVDNAAGMREAVEHLVDIHGARRIAFIRGPESNDEAAVRFEAYRQVLAESGISYDPDLVAIGDFQRMGGAAAMAQLVERPGAIDAVIAANDAMALGALDVLRLNGMKVPEQVAVVGFDDIEEVRYSTPPLTTVRQPLAEQGRRAVELLLGQIRGSRTLQSTVLHTELVARRSCGCFSHDSASHTVTAADSGPASAQRYFDRHRGDVLVELDKAARGDEAGVVGGWAERLVDALLSDLANVEGKEFYAVLDDLLTEAAGRGAELSSWHDVVTTLRGQALRALLSDPSRLARAEELLQQARMLVANAVERSQATQRLLMERWMRTLSESGDSPAAALEFEGLAKWVARKLPGLQITSCYVALYEGENMDQARLLLAHDDQRHSAAAVPGAFAASELVPEGWLSGHRRRSLVVEPLFVRQQQLGYAIFEMGPRTGVIYEALREQISAGLKNALVLAAAVPDEKLRAKLLK